MDQIIDKISAIENETKQIMEDAGKKKQTVAEAVKKETEAFDRSLEESTAARIADLRSRQEQDMAKKLEVQREEAARFLAELDEHYKAHHEEYAEQLFKEMTGA